MLFGREFVDPVWMELEDYQDALRSTLDDPTGLVGFDNDGIRPFGRAVEELKGFSNTLLSDNGPERDWTDEPDEADYLSPMAFTPWRRHLRHAWDNHQSPARRRPQRPVPVREREEVQEMLPGLADAAPRPAAPIRSS